MHPVFGAKKCDPEGHYVSQWLPELAGLPMEYVHCPWEAPREALAAARLSFVRGNSIKRGVSVGVAAARGGGSSGGGGVGSGSKSVSTSAHTYPERLIKDLDQARQRCHDAVMAVRRSPEGLSCMLPCGNETLTLHDGRVARLITRSDYFGCVCKERGGEREREREREREKIIVRTRSPLSPVRIPCMIYCACGVWLPKLRCNIAARVLTVAPLVFRDKPVVFQTPSERMDPKQRRPTSVMGALLHDETKRWNEKHNPTENKEGKERGGRGGGRGGRGRGGRRGGKGDSGRRNDPRFAKRWREDGAAGGHS